MGRDLMTRPYGRFYFLPRELAQRGHKITILLLNYQRGGEEQVLKRDGITWMSRNLTRFGPLHYIREARKLAHQERPDWIFGLSDTYFGIWAQRLGRQFGIRSAIDAYDNYESYIGWLKPLHWAWRRAVASADLVTVAGPQLGILLARGRTERLPIVLPMSADPIGFEPKDKAICREKFNLPTDARIVGYCGSIAENRGIHVLFDAIEHLRRRIPNIILLLSGRVGRGIQLPHHSHWLGYVDDDLMPDVINSLDALAVVNRMSSFGQYSYPVKLYEAMNCQVPAVATRTAATEWILKLHPELLTTPGDAQHLATSLEATLACRRITYAPQPSWADTAMQLESHLSILES